MFIIIIIITVIITTNNGHDHDPPDQLYSFFLSPLLFLLLTFLFVHFFSALTPSCPWCNDADVKCMNILIKWWWHLMTLLNVPLVIYLGNEERKLQAIDREVKWSSLSLSVIDQLPLTHADDSCSPLLLMHCRCTLFLSFFLSLQLSSFSWTPREAQAQSVRVQVARESKGQSIAWVKGRATKWVSEWVWVKSQQCNWSYNTRLDTHLHATSR